MHQEEGLQKKSQAFQKMMDTDDDKNKGSEIEEMLKDVRRRIYNIEQDLYEAESKLSAQPLRKTNDELRQDPKRRLGAEPINDCLLKGGCCSHKCGSCEGRHLGAERRKGDEHFKANFGCCIT